MATNEPRRRAHQPSKTTRGRRGTTVTSGALVRSSVEEPSATLGDGLVEGTDERKVARGLRSSERKFMDADQTQRWIETWNTLSPKYRAMQLRMEEYLSRWNRFRADENFKAVYDELKNVIRGAKTVDELQIWEGSSDSIRWEDCKGSGIISI